MSEFLAVVLCAENQLLRAQPVPYVEAGLEERARQLETVRRIRKELQGLAQTAIDGKVLDEKLGQYVAECREVGADVHRLAKEYNT